MSLNRRVKKLEGKTDGIKGPPPPGHWAWDYIEEMDRQYSEFHKKFFEEIERKNPGWRERVAGKRPHYMPTDEQLEERLKKGRERWAAEIARYPNPEAYEKAQAKLRKKVRLNVEIFREARKKEEERQAQAKSEGQ